MNKQNFEPDKAIESFPNNSVPPEKPDFSLIEKPFSSLESTRFVDSRLCSMPIWLKSTGIRQNDSTNR